MASRQDGFGRICAVVVTFNIGEEFVSNYCSLRSQVDKIVIIDNHSNECTTEMLREIQRGDPVNTEVIFNRDNEGVAKAQNSGIRIALDEEYEWILLLDHDSFLDDSMISNMKRGYARLAEPVRKEVGMLAPRIVDANLGTSSRYSVPFMKFLFRRERCTDGKSIDAMTVISSGSLIKARVLKEIGLMKEDFFIDYIDTEFSLRMKTRGFRIVVLCNAVLHHKLGSRRLYRFLSLDMKPTFHPAQRRYHIYKNKTRVFLEYLFKMPSYALFEVILTTYDIFNVLAYEDDKFGKLGMALRGVAAGLTFKRLDN